MAIKIQLVRIQGSDIVKQYANGKISTDMLLPKLVPAMHDGFAIDTKVAKAIFGNPNGHFMGEWRYAVYHFRLPAQKTEILLFADPVTAGKGTGFEFIKGRGKGTPALAQAVYLELAKQYKSYKRSQNL